MVADYYLVSAARMAHRLRPDRTYVFGRDETVDIVLQDALVSRRHAQMLWRLESWEIEDLNSRNGVFVDSTRIRGPARVTDGSQLQIGGQVFRMHLLPPGGDPHSLGSVAPQMSAVETKSHKVQDTALSGATFSGEVSSGGVLELLQFFSGDDKTGRLDYLGGPATACVWIAEGKPVHAAFDDLLGLEALVSLVQAPPPRFAFTAGASLPTARSLNGSIHAILMEVARMLDLGKR